VKKVFLLAAHFGRFRGLFCGGIFVPQETRGLSAQFRLRNLVPPAPPNFSRMSRTSFKRRPLLRAISSANLIAVCAIFSAVCAMPFFPANFRSFPSDHACCVYYT